MRSKRGRSTKKLSSEQLKAEVNVYVKRLFKLSEETAALLVARGMTYEEICCVACEMAGLCGRIVGLAREGSHRKYYPQPNIMLEASSKTG